MIMTLNQEKLDQLVGRLLGDLSAGYGGVLVSVGHRLGLFKAMAGAGPLTSQELAKRSGCAERYVREWLNAQAAGGYVEYHEGLRMPATTNAATLTGPASASR
jgi:hypothetical protein